MPKRWVNPENFPCKACGALTPTKDGHDPCIPNLPGVIFACCGHGRLHEAYIVFENGVTLRGEFDHIKFTGKNMSEKYHPTKILNSIFVFGSNLAGRHGAGSAKRALQYCGAIYGQGIGRQGNSYAIPTKGLKLQVLPLDEIEHYVDAFLEYARVHSNEEFFLTNIGCGLAGYTPAQIAPMFKEATSNIILSKEFREVLFPLSGV